MAEIKLDWDMEPSDRLQVEINNSKNSAQIIVGKQLLEDFKVDSKLSARYSDMKFTLINVWDSIIERARAELGSKNGAVEDSKVFGWAREFVLDGEIKKVKPVQKDFIGTCEKVKEEIIKPKTKPIKKEEGQLSLW